MKHWPILVIFLARDIRKDWRKWLRFWPPHFHTVGTLPCEMHKS